MAHRKKKRLSSRAFVVTFAVGASACGGGEAAGSGSTGGETPPPRSPSLLGVSDSLRRVGDVCTLYEGNEGCPPDVRCNPPPPRVVTCPDVLSAAGQLVRHADGSCLLIPDEVCVLGPMPTCNPPAPQRVDCDPDALTSGQQQRQGDGACYVHVQAQCPGPQQTCTREPSRTVPCPEPEPS